MEHKKCCFIGHRNAKLDDNQIKRLFLIIKKLISKYGFREFLFGSRSDFDKICHQVVTELKNSEYSFLQRVVYTCRSEFCIYENKREEIEKLFSTNSNKVTFQGYEKEVEFKSKYVAGRNSYIDRNKQMIDDSDFCVLFYDEDYLPNLKKKSKRDFLHYQPNSGTKIAYKYIVKKQKPFINIFEKDKN